MKLQAAPAIPKAPTLSGLSAASVVDEDDGEPSGIVPIAAIAFILALVLLAIELMNFLQAQS